MVIFIWLYSLIFQNIDNIKYQNFYSNANLACILPIYRLTASSSAYLFVPLSYLFLALAYKSPAFFIIYWYFCY